MITIYHGTDKNSADQIKYDGIIKGEKGPGVCLTIESAMEYALLKAKSVDEARVVVVEKVTSKILNNAKKSAKKESFVLMDEFGNPSNGFYVQHVRVLNWQSAESLKREIKRQKNQ